MSPPDRNSAGGASRVARLAVVLAAVSMLTHAARAQHADHGAPASPSTMSSEQNTADGHAPATHDTNGMAGADTAALRDPHAYAEGETFGEHRPMLADEHRFGSLLVDNLEYQRVSGESVVPFDLEFWYGGTYERAVVKSEGEAQDGSLADARTEVLWSHAVTRFWDRQLGVRIDDGIGPQRTWIAFGVEGLAPGWWQIEAAVYAGESSRTALRVDASRDFLLTQRLVLQPRIEASAYGKDDAARGIGSGLSNVTAGLRLRYEIRREIAPYVGLEWTRLYGDTRALASARGSGSSDTRAVVGIRFWF